MSSCGDGRLRPSGQAQRGQVFAGSSTEANFAARESFYYNASKTGNCACGGEPPRRIDSGLANNSYPTTGRRSTFFVVIVTCVDGNFGRG